MAGGMYIRIRHEAITADRFVKKDELRVCRLTEEEVQWVKDSTPSGQADIFIFVKDIESVVRKEGGSGSYAVSPDGKKHPTRRG